MHEEGPNKHDKVIRPFVAPPDFPYVQDVDMEAADASELAGKMVCWLFCNSRYHGR